MAHHRAVRHERTTGETYTIRVHDDGPSGLWGDVTELPGCFASGRDELELRAALDEMIDLFLVPPTVS
ncbi:MAG: type II toxin-antitoxin system HicB family antitoxin [Acidimicrobiales bacterium]